VLDNGDWLLPVFYCVPVPGKKWVGDKDYSAVLLSSDQGKNWKEIVVPGSLGCVHMNIVKMDDGSLTAVFRSRWADHVYLTRSADNGRTWDKPIPSGLPNNNSSVQCTKLANGHLAIVYNNMNAEKCTQRRASLYDDIEDEGSADPVDASAYQAVEAPEAAGKGCTAFWGAPRAPLSIAISEDDGRTWPYRRDLEVGDGFCLTNNSKEAKNREYSYPSIKQTPDGNIHVAFTYFRQRIKYVRIDEEWVSGK
jgi:predicted neuraminidase